MIARVKDKNRIERRGNKEKNLSTGELILHILGYTAGKELSMIILSLGGPTRHIRGIPSSLLRMLPKTWEGLVVTSGTEQIFLDFLDL